MFSVTTVIMGAEYPNGYCSGYHLDRRRSNSLLGRSKPIVKKIWVLLEAHLYFPLEMAFEQKNFHRTRAWSELNHKCWALNPLICAYNMLAWLYCFYDSSLCFFFCPLLPSPSPFSLRFSIPCHFFVNQRLPAIISLHCFIIKN